MKFNEDEVRKFFRFFKHKLATEIRVFDPVKYPQGKSVFVENEDEFVKKCEFFCVEEEVSVYIGARDRKARGDKNVVSSSFIFFEIDEHEEGADKEIEKNKILAFLKDNKIDVTMQGMSGGGYHFYIMHPKQEFATEEQAMQYKEQSLGSFKKVLQGQGFDIDGAVFNLERVTRVMGTYNYKRDKISALEFIDKTVNVEENQKALVELLKKFGNMPTNNVTTPQDNIEDDIFIKGVKDAWVEGDRQELAMSVAGYLRKERGVGLDPAIAIIKGICMDCNDTDINERVAAVKATYNKNEKEIKGATGLMAKGIEVDPRVLSGKIPIELPGDNSYVSVFAKKLAVGLNLKDTLFYRQDSRQVIELGDVKNEKDEVTHTGFIVVSAGRFATLIERYFSPWMWRVKKDGSRFQINKSTTKNDCGIVLESGVFQENIPSINTIFSTQLPIIYDDELTFPCEGYDKRFRSWLAPNSAKISNMNMPLKEAKEVIHNIFKEFCFETTQDFDNAVSAFITPFLRGLFKTGFNTRAPVYCYEANRERSGKDYLAGVTGMLYEGNALEEAPISSGEKFSSGGNDELRKKLISAMISGKKRLHFSNNKGHLNSAVFESVTTATKFTDRLLGKNVEVAFDNEMDFSFSGNLGITLTPDLTNRTIFIKLFLAMEDANQRKFANPNLHKYVLDNRDEILSAMYSLVRNWRDKGSPDGSLPFSSFPEWARVCGGVMEAAGYGNPCVRNIDQSGISIDTETDEMKELFEACYEEHPDEPIDKHQIRSVIIKHNIMNYMNWDSRSEQTKFAFKIKKYVGRILSDIKMSVENKEIRSSRWKFEFNLNKKQEEIKW